MDTGVGGDSAGWPGLKANKGWGNIARQTKDLMHNYAGICGVEVEIKEVLVLVFLTPFNGLFAPTSRSPISKLFRFLVSDLKTFAHKG